MSETQVNQVSGHSVREGATQDLFDLNFDLGVIVQAGRWKSLRMATRYAERVRAKVEVDTLADSRLRYAALELRMAIEGVTYYRAQAYSSEIPPSQYATRQPKRLVHPLLEIDTQSDQTSTIKIGIQKAPNDLAADLTTLGTDTAFGVSSIKEHYDALGFNLPAIRYWNQSLVGNSADLSAW